MNIEDMQKIWNEQEQRSYYVIDEETLFEQIKKRTAGLKHAVSRDEIGLVVISAVAILILLLTKVNTVFNVVTIVMLFLIGIFVLVKRKQRKTREKNYGLSVQDNLDYAISLARYRIRSAQSFVWWYILPLAIPTFGNMYFGNTKEPWQWLLILGAFVLSFFVIRYGLEKRYRPSLKRLLGLKEKLS